MHCCDLQVYERRKAPAGYDSTPADAEAPDSKKGSNDDNNAAAEAEAFGDEASLTQILGGGVRLEMNGLKAIAAISRELAGRVVSEGLYANKVLLHDTQGEGHPLV